MNKRMKALQDKVLAEAYEKQQGMDWVMEKFAELIVMECCVVFVELRTRPADLAVLDVKKHFGVEE